MTASAEILDLAAQYHATGNIALAEQYAKSVLDDEPNHAGALYLLGRISQQKGEPREALVYLNRSLTANGSNGFAWQTAGDILLAGGDLPGCISYYEQALRLRPDFAEGFNTLGMALKRVGQLARAIACFRQAVRLAPSFAPAHNNLGTSLSKQGNWTEAAAVLEEALKLWPDSPEIAFNLGNTRYDQGDVSAAIACFRQALSLKPSYAAEVSNSLATALRRQGLWQEAVAQYHETLRLRPGHGMALYNLSELAVAGHYAFPPEELAQAKEVLAAGRTGEAERILCAFAAGNVLDLHSACDEAFRYFREANDLQLAQFKKRKTAFNARAFQAQADKIMADHGPAYFETVKEWGTPTELPVFIIGTPCSGAALVEELLAGHPRVRCAGEAGNLPRFLSRTAADKNPAATTAQLLPDMRAAQSAAANYLQYLARFGADAARVLVNSLDNALGLGIIAALFPGARVIHCRREPLDAALACYFQNRPDLAFGCSLEDIGAFYRTHDKLMAHWARVLPATIHEVNYEELIQDREKAARALAELCGLDWDESHAAVPAASGPGERPHISGPATIGHSQLYCAHLAPLIKALRL